MLSRLSISTRLALWYGLSLLILLTLFVAGLYAVVHVGMHSEMDRHLRAEADAVRSHLGAHRGLTVLDSDSSSAADSHAHAVAAPRNGFVRVLNARGDVLQTSAAFPQPAFDPAPPPGEERDLQQHTWNGRGARTLYLPLQSARIDGHWLEVTRFESALHHQLHRLRWLLVVGILLGSGGALGIGYMLARTSLRPVAILTQAAHEMKGRPGGTLPTDFERKDELTDLAETFNDLFRRLRTTIERERRFRADAAHELGTPLTAIQSEVDVVLRRDRETDAYRSSLRTVRRHTEELSSILTRLMTLSEVESREDGPADVSLRLPQRVQERIDRIRPRANDRGITIDGPQNAPVTVSLHTHHADLVVDHLLDNALKYSADGGVVGVSVTLEDDDVCVRVEDTGVGFTPDEAHHLFDRFYRTAGARSQAEGGGLGLAIVESVVRSYDGHVTARSDGPGRGSTFEVRLPAD